MDVAGVIVLADLTEDHQFIIAQFDQVRVRTALCSSAKRNLQNAAGAAARHHAAAKRDDTNRFLKVIP